MQLYLVGGGGGGGAHNLIWMTSGACTSSNTTHKSNKIGFCSVLKWKREKILCSK
jgi:hypothetical protein